MLFAMSPLLIVELAGPGTLLDRTEGELMHRVPKRFSTGPSHDHDAAFSGGASHGGGSRLALQTVGAIVSVPIVAEFRQQARGIMGAGAR